MPGGFADSVAVQYSFAGVRLGKKGGLGSPQRFFGDFLCVQKVTRVRGGEPRELSSEAACFGRTPAPELGKPRRHSRPPGGGWISPAAARRACAAGATPVGKNECSRPHTQRDESMTNHTSWCHPHSAEGPSGEGQTPPLLSLSAAEGPAAGVSAPAPALSSPRLFRIGLLQPLEAFLCPAGRGYSVALMAAGLVFACFAIIVRKGAKSQWGRGLSGSACAWD